MIRWIRGAFEASYVGEAGAPLSFGRVHNGKSFRVRVYRAAVSDTAFIDAPADARPPVLETDGAPSEDPVRADEPDAGHPLPPEALDSLFRQARIDQVHVAHARGPGSYLLGPLFDVRVVGVTLSHPVEKDGRAYGRMRGTVVGCVVLPKEAPPERVSPAVLVESAQTREAPAPSGPGELHVAPPPVQTIASDVVEPLASAPSARAASARTSAPRTSIPLSSFGAAALVALVLAVRCGVAPCLLWTLFMLPTLLARKLFRGVLQPSAGLGVAGAILVALQVICVSNILSMWWSADCKELALLPMVGVIAVLFPSGLLPARLPLLLNAAGLALVLFSWCTGPAAHCREQPGFGEPSVADPRVPRTNADGSWPRRPPGR